MQAATLDAGTSRVRDTVQHGEFWRKHGEAHSLSAWYTNSSKVQDATGWMDRWPAVAGSGYRTARWTRLAD